MIDAVTEIGASLRNNGLPIGRSKSEASARPNQSFGCQAGSPSNDQQHRRVSSPAVEIFVPPDPVFHPGSKQPPGPQRSSTPIDHSPPPPQRSSLSPRPSDNHIPADARHHNGEPPVQANGYRGGSESASSPPDADKELADVYQLVQKLHQPFMRMMDARSSTTGIIKSFFERGDIRGCITAAQRQGDPAFTVDVFRFLARDDRPREFRLNMCAATAGAVRMCLSSRADDVVKVALSFARLVLKGFAEDIQVGCRQRDPSARDPVDLKGDERRANCREAKDSFMELLPELHGVLESKRPLAVKERAQDVIDRILSLAK
jgi:hypothetical protein